MQIYMVLKKSSSQACEVDIQALQLRKQELEAYVAHVDKEREKERYIAAQVAQLDYDNLTPKQALDLLWQLKNS